MRGKGPLKGRGPRRGRIIPLVLASFYVGGMAGWWLHASRAGVPSVANVSTTRDVERPAAQADRSPTATTWPTLPTGPTGGPTAATGTSGTMTPAADDETPPRQADDPIADLRRHNLRLPIDDAEVARMSGSFTERRDRTRSHEAVDILAPRNTPIRATEDGTIVKLFQSKQGGTTIYQFDPSERFCYYYAHLERYAAGLHEGQRVSRGDVIGYVGTSGNAPPGTPHLHFAISELTPAKHWWEGRAIDPYLAFKPDS